jgi:hypothetical protein
MMARMPISHKRLAMVIVATLYVLAHCRGSKYCNARP